MNAKQRNTRYTNLLQTEMRFHDKLILIITEDEKKNPATEINEALCVKDHKKTSRCIPYHLNFAAFIQKN